MLCYNSPPAGGRTLRRSGSLRRQRKSMKSRAQSQETKRPKKPRLAQAAARPAAAKPVSRPRSKAAKKAAAAAITAILKSTYPDAECALRHDDAFQLLIATILSAQCTDERVNMVTPELFARHPTAADLAVVPLETLEKLIQSTGFFRNKARNIQACCRLLVEKHGGQVPRTLEQLVELPGIGRKTANVVLGTAYGVVSGVVVDTHVARLSYRLGLTTSEDPEKIERDLMTLLPPEEWIMFSHRLIHHGRQICKARKPLCDRCPLVDLCPKLGVATTG